MYNFNILKLAVNQDKTRDTQVPVLIQVGFPVQQVQVLLDGQEPITDAMMPWCCEQQNHMSHSPFADCTAYNSIQFSNVELCKDCKVIMAALFNLSMKRVDNIDNDGTELPHRQQKVAWSVCSTHLNSLYSDKPC